MLLLQLIFCLVCHAVSCQDSTTSVTSQPKNTTVQNPRLIMGPENYILDEQNPDSNFPPSTDYGGMATFKYPFSFAQKKITKGGWTRQVTVRDLPLSTGMAGVQMYLIQGGVREMHWHVTSEWAYVINGTCRITAVDQHGNGFVEDVSAEDLWFFPGGIPHSIQGLGDRGCFFLLTFNDGSFSEFDTFMVTAWMNRVPNSVLAKNFQVNGSLFTNIPPESDMYIFPAQLPRALAVEKQEVSNGTGLLTGRQSLAFFTQLMAPNKTVSGGNVRIIDQNNFPVVDISAAIVTLQPGGLRELHWHPNADEWQYYVQGNARMGVFQAGGNARTMDFTAGDVGYITKSTPHYVENTGDTELVFLEIFPTSTYEDVSLAEWLAHTPSRLVNEHIFTGEAFIDQIDKLEAVLQPQN